jgi:hypothetical protein
MDNPRTEQRSRFGWHHPTQAPAGYFRTDAGPLTAPQGAAGFAGGG